MAVQATEVQFLGAQEALDEIEDPPIPVIVFTYRLNPTETYKPSNMMLTAKQAIRLRDDIDSLFATSESLKDAINETLD